MYTFYHISSIYTISFDHFIQLDAMFFGEIRVIPADEAGCRPEKEHFS